MQGCIVHVDKGSALLATLSCKLTIASQAALSSAVAVVHACSAQGWDKTYCLRFVEGEFDEIHFFGDKTFPVSISPAVVEHVCMSM
jgi:hypothetical protein